MLVLGQTGALASGCFISLHHRLESWKHALWMMPPKPTSYFKARHTNWTNSFPNARDSPFQGSKGINCCYTFLPLSISLSTHDAHITTWMPLCASASLTYEHLGAWGKSCYVYLNMDSWCSSILSWVNIEFAAVSSVADHFFAMGNVQQIILFFFSIFNCPVWASLCPL